jgi:hypothetical protein
MALNSSPVFGSTPVNSWDTAGALTAANTNMDGTGTVQTIFTAGADGAFVEKVIAKPVGTNVATVLRIFVNNGSSTTSAANNKLIAELGLQAITGSNSQAQLDFEKILNLRLAPSYRITCCIGTAVANGWHVSAHGASYTA